MQNKYIVYIDREWLQVECRRRMLHSAAEQQKFITTIRDMVSNVLRGIDDNIGIFADTFIGSDGKRHHAIEIKAVPGCGKHPYLVLKRIYKMRKK